MDPQERGARHGVRQPGSRGAAKRLHSRRQAFVERTESLPERDDLRPREI